MFRQECDFPVIYFDGLKFPKKICAVHELKATSRDYVLQELGPKHFSEAKRSFYKRTKRKISNSTNYHSKKRFSKTLLWSGA